MVTYDELVNGLKLGAADAGRLLVAIERGDDVPDVLALASEVMDAFGEDGLTDPRRPAVGILEYVNVGDPCKATLCFDPERGDFFVGCWRDFLETWEQENDYNACGQCGEEMDSDCMGRPRCDVCDDPCPHCYDGGGPDGADDDDSDDVEYDASLHAT